jgi:hypothetical protein
MSKIEIIEGHLLNEDGVTPVTMAAHLGVDPLRLGRPGIQYTPMDMPPVRDGDMLTFRHAIMLCGRCGGYEGMCGCES